MNIVIAIISAYLLGSIPTSYLMGKILKGIDIRQFGSGNVGATNALRVLGTKVGIITLVIDILKGFFAVLLGKLFIPEFTDSILIIIGIAAILGHIFTLFLKFKGGKGVATSAGVFIALTPIPLMIALFIFIITVWISKYVSLGSILASLTLLIAELVINIQNSFAEIEKLVMVFMVAFFIVVKHKSNLIRLLSGTENKISLKKSR